MEKFNRNYYIEFEIGKRYDLNHIETDEQITISYPITLRFQIQQNPYAKTNSGSFQLVNLSDKTQKLLYKDRFDLSKYIKVKLYAGYNDTMPCIYDGIVAQCYSYRDSGSTDFVTYIETYSATYMFLNGYVNMTLSEGTQPKDLVEAMLQEALPDLKLGYISKELKPLQSDQTFLGNMYDLIRDEYPDMQVYVNQGELHIIAENEVIPGDVPVITASTGLLGTPRRAEQYYEVETLFEPGIKALQQVAAISQTTPFVNNYYRVLAVRHFGVISPVEDGELKSVFTLARGSQNRFKTLEKEPETYGEMQTSGIWQKPTKIGRITSPYGKRTKPLPNASENHQGIDIGGTPLMTPVYAVNSGYVSFCGYDGGYGKTIKINHGKINGVTVVSRYSHLNGYAVSQNKTVAAGEIIGYVGNTGISTAPHLHFGIYEDNAAVNPIKYIGSY